MAHAVNRLAAPVVVAALVAICGPARAQDAPEPSQTGCEQTINRLESQIENLAAQLELLRAELGEFKQQQAEAVQEAEIDRLRQAAAATLAEGAAEGPVLDTETAFASGTRMQPQLNPEISVTGDIWAQGGNTVREELKLNHFELDFQSYLDPFSRFHLVVGLGQHDHGWMSGPDDEGDEEEGHGEEHGDEWSAEVEEGYITWFSLPANLNLTLGKKRQQFGVVNRWHMHALDQADYPWVVTESFGDHGLAGTGVSVDWLMPKLWADANELTFELTNGDNEVAFAGGDWSHPTVLARLKSYWDLNQDSYFELGLNALHGSADPDGHLSNDFLGLDLTYNWFPAGRELYKDITLRGMIVRSERELADGGSSEAWGGYLYGQYKLSRSWIVGMRYDRVEDQLDEEHHYWGLSPYVTFWQSEFVRLRAQMSYRKDNLYGTDRRFLIQTTLSAGPHKHDTY